MSWYWLDHTLIPQRTIYLFLSKQLHLIEDVNVLIHRNMKQLLSPWSKFDNQHDIEWEYCFYHRYKMTPFGSPFNFKNMTMKGCYKLMRIETNQL